MKSALDTGSKVYLKGKCMRSREIQRRVLARAHIPKLEQLGVQCWCRMRQGLDEAEKRSELCIDSISKLQGKDGFFNDDTAVALGNNLAKIKLDPYLTPCTKIKSRYIKVFLHPSLVCALKSISIYPYI